MVGNGKVELDGTIHCRRAERCLCITYRADTTSIETPLLFGSAIAGLFGYLRCHFRSQLRFLSTKLPCQEAIEVRRVIMPTLRRLEKYCTRTSTH